MKLKTLVCSGLIALVSASCGAGDTSDGWAGTVRDSAGIAIVENPAEGLWTAESRWTVREDLRIGTMTGAPEYQFGMIWDIAVDDSGSIYVLDEQAQTVRVFDPEGQYIRTIGSPGDGPGELTPPLRSLMIGPGDTLYVPLTGQQRVQRYLLDGTLAGGFRTPLSKGLPIKWLIGPEGTLVSQLRSFSMPGTDAAPLQGDVLMARAGDGTIVDTLLVLPRGGTFSMASGPSFNFFAPEPVWSLGADGSIISAMNSGYRIEYRSLNGGLERIITMPFERQPVSDSERQMFTDMFRQIFRDQGVPPAALDRINIQVAEFYPAFSNMMAGPGGTLWVQHISSIESLSARAEAGSLNGQDFGSPRWDVFDANGRYLGIVTLPDRFQPWTFTTDHVYGVWRDELDVQYVVRLEIVRPGNEEAA